MSALLAAGWSRPSRHGVSVVPTIQRSPHGMTKSTLVGVRRISPACVPPASVSRAPSMAERGSTRCTPLDARTRRLGAAMPSISPMSSLQTPVAATTLRARTVNELPSVRSATRTPTTGACLPPPTPLAVPQQPDHAGAGQHPRAVAGGRADDGEGVAGVVDLGVPVPDRPPDDVAAQAREGGQRPLARQVPVPGDLPPGGERGAQHVVEGHAGAEVGALPGRPGEREQERQRGDQVRRDRLHQPGALGQRLADQREGELLQVAQATVDELARPAGRAGRPVTGLEQPDREPAARRVQRRTGAGDPAADHQDVDDLVGQPGAVGPPARRTQLRVARIPHGHHCAPSAPPGRGGPAHATGAALAPGASGAAGRRRSGSR